MNTGIRFVGFFCAALAGLGAAFVISGESSPAGRAEGVPMVEMKAGPGGDGGSRRAAFAADRPGKFSQNAQAVVGDGITARATVLVSEPMLDAAERRPVRSVAVIVTVMEEGRLLQSASELHSMSADGAEAITFAASACEPAGAGGDDDYSYELVVRPRDGLTWGETEREGNLSIDVNRSTD